MSNRVSEEIANKLKDSILYGDITLWSALIKISDDTALQSINKWFEDYFVAHKVKDCEIVLDDLNSHIFEFKCSIKVEYQEYDDFMDYLLIKIEPENDNKTFRIVCIEQIYSPNDNSDLLWYVKFKKERPWWKSSTFRYETSQNDDIPYNLLARAVTRNIRFREAHIQLECASLLTCMMSPVIPGICQQINLPHENSEEKIKTIYNVVRAKFSLQMIRTDRDNTWASKYLAPWYGLDEILANRETYNKIFVSCNAFMTILYSLLRWSGFKTSQVVQFRIINQDYLIVQNDEQKLYLISHDRLILCNKRTIYPSGKISKVFGAEWYIDFKNDLAEANPELIQEYNYIAENTFLPKCSLTGNKKGFLITNSNLSFQDFRHRMLHWDNQINSSIFMWAKYSNQTLFISKPETYIYWSVQSNWGSNIFKNEEEIFDYIRHLRRKSIFPENDRIMTADQCIRHQAGGNKDIAVFLCAALKKFLNMQGCVVLTKRYEYCVYRRYASDELVIFNIRLQKPKKIIEGDVILAFNDTNSYYPLRDSNHTNRAWYNKLINK